MYRVHRVYGACAGVREEKPPGAFRFSRQSRWDGHIRQGFAGELGILGVLGVFCAGVREKWLSVASRFL